MLIDKVFALLKDREFLTIATADKAGLPNAAPKFLLKLDLPHIYLVDYTIAQTAENLRTNPRASLALMDIENLQGYRLRGSVALVESGAEFKRLAEELQKKIVRLSADRVIEATHTGKKYSHFELEIPDEFIVIKFKAEDVAKIGARGSLYRESVGEGAS